jgi:hypothetical protein
VAHPWKGWLPAITIAAFSCCWVFANAKAKSMFPSLAAHFLHNFIMTILVRWIPDLCQTPPEVSFSLWACGTMICFGALQMEMKRLSLPKALIDDERDGLLSSDGLL